METKKNTSKRSASKYVGVRIPNDLHAELTRLSRDLGVTLSQLLIGGAKYQVWAINEGMQAIDRAKGK